MGRYNLGSPLLDGQGEHLTHIMKDGVLYKTSN